MFQGSSYLFDSKAHGCSFQCILSLYHDGKLYGIDGETVSDFIFLGSKITADGDCSHEIKRPLLLGRKVMTNLDSIFKKQRRYFANKGPSSQGYGFSCDYVWM